MELFRIIASAGIGGWITLGILLIMSVFSWAIMIRKWQTFKSIRNRSKKFLDTFWQSRNLENLYEAAKEIPPSPVSRVFQSGYVELVKLSKAGSTEANSNLELSKIDNVERALRRSSSAEISSLEKYLSFLATTGSTAPFIGLFGTVLGIMRSFHQIGLTGSANLADVAPGISEALLATAAGLAAAIPAVVAFNQYQSKLRTVSGELDNFSSDFLNIVKRNFFR